MAKTKVDINRDTKQIIVIRDFNAPLNMVWDACTKPELVAKWWGPRAFTTVVREMDVRPGGVWHYVMIGTGEELKGTQFEGMESGGKALYEEVVEQKLIVFKDIFVDKDGNEMQDMPVATNTWTFEEKNGKTTVTMIGQYEALEDLEKVVQMGVEEGLGETIDRLEELLAK